MAEIERGRVKRAFSCHAEQYEAFAQVQKQVVTRFDELFRDDLASSKAILDVGSGTGLLVERIGAELPQVPIVGVDLALGMIRHAQKRFHGRPAVGLVCGDAEQLPFGDCSFDTVISTSTYQWLSPLEVSFGEVWRVLKPGGCFQFAMFGRDTLSELRHSYRTAANLLNKEYLDRTHNFASAIEVVDALRSVPFSSPSLITEAVIQRYPDVPSLIRAVNGIGAGSAAGNRPSGLAGRSVMLKMMELYERNYATAGVIPATYQVFYGTARKLQAR